MPPAVKKKSEVPTLPLSDRTLNRLTQVFKLLADESRLRILLTLSREGEMHVTALCTMLGQSQPAVSHHLTLLRMADLVGFRRDGKFNYYRMDAGQLGDTLERLFADAGKGSSLNFGDFALTYSRSGVLPKRR
ncbi:MAG: metalloregulator ArsR/SmtB family transcription factor [Gemmataceae bacterium]